MPWKAPAGRGGGRPLAAAGGALRGGGSAGARNGGPEGGGRARAPGAQRWAWARADGASWVGICVAGPGRARTGPPGWAYVWSRTRRRGLGWATDRGDRRHTRTHLGNGRERRGLAARTGRPRRGASPGGGERVGEGVGFVGGVGEGGLSFSAFGRAPRQAGARPAAAARGRPGGRHGRGRAQGGGRPPGRGGLFFRGASLQRGDARLHVLAVGGRRGAGPRARCAAGRGPKRGAARTQNRAGRESGGWAAARARAGRRARGRAGAGDSLGDGGARTACSRAGGRGDTPGKSRELGVAGQPGGLFECLRWPGRGGGSPQRAGRAAAARRAPLAPSRRGRADKGRSWKRAPPGRRGARGGGRGRRRPPAGIRAGWGASKARAGRAPAGAAGERGGGAVPRRRSWRRGGVGQACGPVQASGHSALPGARQGLFGGDAHTRGKAGPRPPGGRAAARARAHGPASGAGGLGAAVVRAALNLGVERRGG
jgi:hypothetical protein